MVHSIWNAQPAIQQALETVKQLMKADLRMPHQQVKEKIIEYMDAPGKYIRAGLVLLVAQATEGEIREAKLYFAAAVEVLHLATLIHDDVIDEADTRRGMVAMHRTHSNRIAIYAGDYLLAYAGRLLKKGTELLLDGQEKPRTSIDERIMERILAGELAQLLNQHKSDMTMKDYLTQIKGKTAFLFALSCQLGAWTISTEAQQLRFAFNAGQAVGMAFQLSDDLLDYQVSAEEMGKPALQDVQNGIYTAPLLFAMVEDKQLSFWLKEQTQKGLTDEMLVTLQQRIGATTAYAQTERLIDKYLLKAQQFFKKADMDEKWFLFLEGIMRRKF